MLARVHEEFVPRPLPFLLGDSVSQPASVESMMLACRISQRSSACLARQVPVSRQSSDRVVLARAEEKPVQRTVEAEGDSVPETSQWAAIDDRIGEQVYSDDWEDTLPLPFIAAVSTFGTALTGVCWP